MLDNDLTLSNGLAWSTDGMKMYSVDTIVRRSTSATTTPPAEQWIGGRTFGSGLVPDGIAMDVEDHLWVAVWGEGEVRRFAPDGSLVVASACPPSTSCVAFAGEDADAGDHHGHRRAERREPLGTAQTRAPLQRWYRRSGSARSHLVRLVRALASAR